MNGLRPRPKIKRPCKACGVTWSHIESREVTVSPRGIAHFGHWDGTTACGKDATSDAWWWQA